MIVEKVSQLSIIWIGTKMKTQVVNLHKGKYDVYIGRRGKGFDGYFGNPVHIGRRCACGITHCYAGGTIPCFREYFYKRIANDAQFKASVDLLKGLRLGCFCKPGPCHGDVIVEYLEDEEARKMWEIEYGPDTF
jgi:hypothetical protein